MHLSKHLGTCNSRLFELFQNIEKEGMFPISLYLYTANTTLIPKFYGDSTKTNVLTNFLTKILTKSPKIFIQRLSYNDKIGFVPGRNECFDIRIYITIIHERKSIKRETQEVFNKIQDLFSIKLLKIGLESDFLNM